MCFFVNLIQPAILARAFNFLLDFLVDCIYMLFQHLIWYQGQFPVASLIMNYLLLSLIFGNLTILQYSKVCDNLIHDSDDGYITSF